MLRTALILFTAVSTARAIVIPPENTTSDHPLAVVIVQGAFISPDQYVDLGKAMQHNCTSPLWVGIAEGFLDNTPNPLQITSAINRVLSAMSEAGMPESAAVFIAGHSLGGVFIPAYVESHTDSVSGMMMFGSYLTGEALGEFPTPVLHLSGTLDGQTRCTRVSSTYAELQQLQDEDDTTALLKPVLIVDGVNHAHFFTGNVPPSVAENDILSELSKEEGMLMLVERCLAFMEVVRDGVVDASDEAKAVLIEGYTSTGEFLAPLYEAQSREANGSESSFATEAQETLLNATGLNLNVISTHEPDLGTLEHQHPGINITGGNSANITVYSSVEVPFNPLDISVNPQTSSEVAVKMVSQQYLQSLLPDGDYGQSLTCKDINEMTLSHAIDFAAPDNSRERFLRRGKPVQFLEDHMTVIGPLWVQERLRLHYNSDGLSVQSVAIYSDIDSPFYPGSHYCKLISPSRALEYVLIDGLRGTQP